MSQSNKSTLYRINKLTGSANLVTWLQDFQALAEVEGLWAHFVPDLDAQLNIQPDIANHIIAQPPLAAPAARVREQPAPPPAPIQHDQTAYKEAWRQHNDHLSKQPKAMGLIKLAVDPTIREKAQNHATPLEFLNWLRN
jgi:hypothetical protein